MSITDPLIKELKAYTFRATQEFENNSEITDTSENLLPLCSTLEGILQKGFIGHCWDWLEELKSEMEKGVISRSFSFIRAVDTAKACHKIKTPTGRLRLLIRCCLVNKCLHIPIEIMVRTYKNHGKQWYDNKCSILGDEILGEIFLSVVLQLSTLCFKLDISNARFLDSTFIVPQCVEIEFVPCNSLGVTVTFIDDKALIVQVDEKSVAAEDNQVEVGDVLDELNGQILKAEMRGKLNNIMNKSKSKPISVRLIKLINKEDDSIYPPIKPLLRKANIDLADIKREVPYDKNEKEIEGRYPLRGGPRVKYVGSMVIGSEGDVKQIEYAVSSLLSNKTDTEPVEVYVECQELGLKVIAVATGKILFQNSFMEISSCGQTRKYPNYFAYIAGDNICNLAKKFTCYVFETENNNDIQTILQSIGQGFQRTHFAV
ncbi:hypothetical protein RUM43_004687 [Polyplax serrata]|uniref:RUN domain-containing protein n=1 Tax=Polyplax serrata TaxID=468196 RepID=A0AAN8SC19_POLSC